MADKDNLAPASRHGHVFLGADHDRAARRTWAVIWLCGAMMALEIIGGALFGSIALIADGLHMSTHAGALLLAALAYSYARRHAGDARFTFGTGKLGDLAGFTSAIVLAMIAILIGYEAIIRIFAPVPIHFREAIPIAFLGLVVNIGSAWLLSGGQHDHQHGHRHGGGDVAHGHEEEHRVDTGSGTLVLSIYEDAHPPVFRIRADGDLAALAVPITIETERADGSRQAFKMEKCRNYFQSIDEIPEPHSFTAQVRTANGTYPAHFEERDDAGQHGGAHRDNNMRAAIIHVMADAAVSVLVITGLVLARAFGWVWMDPVAGIVGAFVIASWSYGLLRDTGAILLDMTPDAAVERNIRQTIEAEGDHVNDLHLWRLGPGHLGAILSIATDRQRDQRFYCERLAGVSSLSHLTVEVEHIA